MLTSQDELHALCEEHDIVCLQETWLTKEQLTLLSNTHGDFIGSGVSSIDDGSGINVGRPFGGIGILWRRTLNIYCSVRTYDCDRIIGLEFNCDSFSALFLCIYMPFDCSDNYDDYMFYLNRLV